MTDVDADDDDHDDDDAVADEGEVDDPPLRIDGGNSTVPVHNSNNHEDDSRERDEHDARSRCM